MNAVEMKPYEPGKINAFTSALTAAHTKIHANTRFILSENKKYKQIGQNRQKPMTCVNVLPIKNSGDEYWSMYENS